MTLDEAIVIRLVYGRAARESCDAVGSPAGFVDNTGKVLYDPSDKVAAAAKELADRRVKAVQTLADVILRRHAEQTVDWFTDADGNLRRRHRDAVRP